MFIDSSLCRNRKVFRDAVNTNQLASASYKLLKAMEFEARKEGPKTYFYFKSFKVLVLQLLGIMKKMKVDAEPEVLEPDEILFEGNIYHYVFNQKKPSLKERIKAKVKAKIDSLLLKIKAFGRKVAEKIKSVVFSKKMKKLLEYLKAFGLGCLKVLGIILAEKEYHTSKIQNEYESFDEEQKERRRQRIEKKLDYIIENIERKCQRNPLYIYKGEIDEDDIMTDLYNYDREISSAIGKPTILYGYRDSTAFRNSLQSKIEKRISELKAKYQ